MFYQLRPVLQSCWFPMTTDGAVRSPEGFSKLLLVECRHMDTQLEHCSPCHSVKPANFPDSTERRCSLIVQNNHKVKRYCTQNPRSSMRLAYSL